MVNKGLTWDPEDSQETGQQKKSNLFAGKQLVASEVTKVHIKISACEVAKHQHSVTFPVNYRTCAELIHYLNCVQISINK
jgi:hypothetical protein